MEKVKKKEEQKIAAMKILQEKLSLAKLPKRIEYYVISNISGKHAVGSLVVFQERETTFSNQDRSEF